MEGKTFREKSLPLRRAAAEALGRIGDDRAVSILFRALDDKDNDRTLDHSITYALIELDNRDYLKNKLDSDSPRVRRACLAALDQLGEKLDPKVVLDALKSNDAALRETAFWIVARHLEWAEQLTGYFREQLSWAEKLNPAERDDLAGRLAKFARSEAIQKLIAEMVRDAHDEPRLIAAQAMARANLKEPPADWYDALAVAIATNDCSRELPDFVRTAAVLAQPKQQPAKLTEALFAVAQEDRHPPDVCLTALAAIHPSAARLDATGYTLALDCIGKDEPAALRSAAAEAFSRAKLTNPQLIGLTVNLKKAGPLDLPKLIGVFAKSTDEKVGMALVKALRDPELRPAVRTELVKPILDKYPKSVQAEAAKLYAELAEARKDESARLEKILAELKPGDVRRGQAVFNSTKTSCIACHTIGYVGGKIGPDLTRIGAIRQERDLLESILFPSASFVRSYEPLTVRTKDGKVFNGIPKKDAPDEIVLILAADKEQRIAREDVDEVQPGKVSIMPAGLDKQLSEQELADLIAFLKACK
jgi:putative heme-binding domain-containing protein